LRKLQIQVATASSRCHKYEDKKDYVDSYEEDAVEQNPKEIVQLLVQQTLASKVAKNLPQSKVDPQVLSKEIANICV